MHSYAASIGSIARPSGVLPPWGSCTGDNAIHLQPQLLVATNTMCWPMPLHFLNVRRWWPKTGNGGIQGVLVRRARARHLFGLLPIPTPVFGVDSTPGMGGWHGAIWDDFSSWISPFPVEDMDWPSSNWGYGGRLKRSARAVQLFGRLAVLETHTLRY